MDLTEKNYPERVMKVGGTTFEVAAGQTFKIETTPDGQEVLNVECPDGKVWSVSIQIHLTETDM